MGKGNLPFVVFNGGIIGDEVLGRTDLEKYPNTAKVMENYLPTTQGPMAFRPGLIKIKELTAPDDAYSWSRGGDNYIMLFGNETVSFVLNDEFIEYPTVTASLPSIASWTLSDATVLSDELTLNSNGTSKASATTSMSINEIGTLHALSFKITRGKVGLKISEAGNVFFKGDLMDGVHYLTFTPTQATVDIEFYSYNISLRQVDAIQLASGRLILETPWNDFKSLRFQKSANVIFVGSGDGKVKRFERRGSNSMSLVDYDDHNGPWLPPNTDDDVTVQPSVVKGVGTLTASRDLFEDGHEGAIWKIRHTGQLQEKTVDGDGQWSDPIKVSGVGSDRQFSYSIDRSGTFVATIRIQRSVGNVNSFTDYKSYTGDGGSIADGLDNNIIYYRIGIKSGEYTSGSADVSLSYSGGSTEGIARITAVTSDTLADIEVLDPFGATTLSHEWTEGAWSAKRGFPKAIGIVGGRIWTGSTETDEVFSTYSGSYNDYRVEDGDSDAISRQIATGTANIPEWILGLNFLVFGTQDSETGINMNAFNEAVTATNFNPIDIATQGCANLSPVKTDQSGIYLSKDGITLNQLVYVPEASGYAVRSLMRLHKDLGRPGISQLAISEHPDTRCHAIRKDGAVLPLLYVPEEKIESWSTMTTDGLFKSMAVISSGMEDINYFVVERKIEGVDRWFLEKQESLFIEDVEHVCRMDCAVKYEGVPISVLTGLDHLEGKTVVTWADGKRQPDKIVVGGQIPLDHEASIVYSGLGYEGRYQSSYLAYAASGGSALGQWKRVQNIRVLLDNCVGQIAYGPDFDNMDELNDSAVTNYGDPESLRSMITDKITMPGDHDLDARFCLRSRSPFPAEVKAYVLELETNG